MLEFCYHRLRKEILMKKTLKKLLSLVLVVVTIFSVSAFMPATALAANQTTNYKNYTQPSGPDYAYWNGKRMVKHKGTYKSNVQWMQASLNYCIKYKGLRASYLDVDGSFGPASKKATLAFQKKYGLKQDGSFGPGTITKMKSVLSSSSKPTPKPTNAKYNLLWPTSKRTISGKYGVNGKKRGTRYHSGIDISAEKGDPCYAVADGTVVMCKNKEDSKVGGRGRYIVIYHSKGDFSSLYEHLDSCYVKVGDSVRAGEKIGKTGNSGWISKGKHYGAHLHFGLMNGKMTNLGYDLWTLPGQKYNGRTYSNNTFDPDYRYNSNVKYSYK